MVPIPCQNESYEFIIKDIWGTVMILNLQFKINIAKK